MGENAKLEEEGIVAESSVKEPVRSRTFCVFYTNFGD